MFEDDIEFCKNGMSVYVSKGILIYQKYFWIFIYDFFVY